MAQSQYSSVEEYNKNHSWVASLPFPALFSHSSEADDCGNEGPSAYGTTVDIFSFPEHFSAIIAPKAIYRFDPKKYPPPGKAQEGECSFVPGQPGHDLVSDIQMAAQTMGYSLASNGSASEKKKNSRRLICSHSKSHDVTGREEKAGTVRKQSLRCDYLNVRRNGRKLDRNTKSKRPIKIKGNRTRGTPDFFPELSAPADFAFLSTRNHFIAQFPLRKSTAPTLGTTQDSPNTSPSGTVTFPKKM